MCKLLHPFQAIVLSLSLLESDKKNIPPLSTQQAAQIN